MTYGDYITKATVEERKEMRRRIEAIIGTKEQARQSGKNLNERIRRASAWDKSFEKLSMVFFEHGEKALALNYTVDGWLIKGITASGKRWNLERNNGYTSRSEYCGTLYIEGIGTIFTSGRLEKCFEYVLNN